MLPPFVGGMNLTGGQFLHIAPLIMQVKTQQATNSDFDLNYDQMRKMKVKDQRLVFLLTVPDT